MVSASSQRKWFWKTARIGGYLIVAWLIVSWIVASKLTQRRTRPFAEPVPIVGWARFESWRLSTGDDQQIGSWYATGTDDAAPSVLLLHGNGGQRSHLLGRAELLARQGCSVCLISLRAHGDSSGEYNDIGFGARRDVIAAIDYLERRRPGKPILILGTSLGAAAALFAAKELDHRVAGYLLESPYQDLRIAVRNRTENELPPILDWIAYRGLLAVAPLVIPHLDKISLHDAITRVPADIPILILAGAEDLSARQVEAEALRDRAREHSVLQVFPATGHLQMMQTDPKRYQRVLLEFLQQIRAGRVVLKDEPARR